MAAVGGYPLKDSGQGFRGILINRKIVGPPCKCKAPHSPMAPPIVRPARVLPGVVLGPGTLE